MKKVETQESIPQPFIKLIKKVKKNRESYQKEFAALATKCPYRCETKNLKWDGCSKDGYFTSLHTRTFSLSKCLIQYCPYLT